MAFVAYVAGLPPQVSIERLPQLWDLPASKFLEQIGVPPGLSWAALIVRGDMLVLAAIALLAASSILCLAAVIPIFWRRGERLFVLICLLQIAVLFVAGSGVLSGTH